eukprot:12055254-Ditylum_brightwellii.AAC.1
MSILIKKVDKLISTLLQHLLPWMGYQCMFPYTVIFGSKFYGGMGVTHLKAHQMSAKICGALKHIQATTKIGHTFIAMVHWTQ